MGLRLVGWAFDEEAVLRAAAALEQAAEFEDGPADRRASAKPSCYTGVAERTAERTMVEPSLEFIAERLERLQTEFRAFRHLSSDVAQLRAELLRVQENLSDLRESHDALRLSHDALRESHDALRDYVLDLRRHIDAGFAGTGDHFRAIQVQFDQMAQQMATNLEIVLAEIRRDRP